MPKFMLILHQSPKGFGNQSPEELERIIGKYRSWSDKFRSAGTYVSGEKLQEEGGKLLTAREGRLSVVDGPYSECKEVVGGYFMFRADNYEHAIELTRDCPHLAFGRVEIRQTDDMGCGNAHAGAAAVAGSALR